MDENTKETFKREKDMVMEIIKIHKASCMSVVGFAIIRWASIQSRVLLVNRKKAYGLSVNFRNTFNDLIQL